MTHPGNVLFVVADQWRGDCLSRLGHTAVRTPNLDALAARATLFRRHHTVASPCGPARASLLTGLYAMNHRSVRNGTPLDARHATLPREARRAGVAPALFGYTDTSADPRLHPPGDPALKTYEGVMAGFEAGCVMLEDMRPWAEHLRDLGHDVPPETRDLYRPPEGHADGPLAAPARYAAADSDTAYLTDRFLSWLDGQGDRPWFAHLAYLRPHPPWIAPEPWHQAVDPACVPDPIRAPSPAEQAAMHPWLRWRMETFPTGAWVRGHEIHPGRLSDGDLRRLRATYYGLIAEMDHHVGRVVARLEETGALDDTLVVVTSDHGETLGDHWMLGKEGWFDEAFHIPLVVRDPRRPAGHGRTVEAFTESVDVMPTILDWLGVSVPPACDGRPLRPWLDGGTPAGWRQAAHWEFDFRDVAGQAPERALGLDSDACGLAVLRSERYEYVHFAGLPPLLFDLASDPGRQRDLAGDPGHAAILAACAQEMLSWRMRHAERGFTHVWLGPEGPVERPPAR
ncbi:alkaline phosphatase family protein [Arenibaculum pallidiluteum]|uniref:alkaline phosphatase family protein n=1 Tax=Arenibaculum pallidiluteum TaxID=2812559 RepID=UPI001A9617BD|nr:alkaline phosphatase family protein [Arenibaculum pallidiluteum]